MKNHTIINGIEYATNDSDEGLFKWVPSCTGIGKEWRQILGTCQFTVKGLKHPKEKIKRAVNGA